MLDGAIFPDDDVESHRALDAALLRFERIIGHDFANQIRCLDVSSDAVTPRMAIPYRSPSEISSRDFGSSSRSCSARAESATRRKFTALAMIAGSAIVFET